MHDPYEVLHWRDKFGLGQNELQRAVERVGSSAGAVEQELTHRVQ